MSAVIEGSTASPDKSAAPAGPHESLRWGEAVAIIVGIVVGAGIFKAPSLVAGMAGDTAWMFAAWVLGGLLSLVGALCYAELATAHPHPGGDYHYLRRAYGPSVSLLFGWARLAVITTGSIALLAFVFGDYMQAAVPLPVAPALGSACYAALAVVVLSWVNLAGLQAGSRTQVALTIAEIAGLLLVVVAALTAPSAGAAPAAAPAASSAPGASMFGLAMVFVLLTYGGWNEAAYISAELKDRRRTMARALVVSLALITLLYVLVNWAYWKGLGLEGMAKSDAIAAELLGRAFGPAGERVISAIICVAALTSMNATMMVGARTAYALGADWPALRWLGRWDAARNTPATALRVQGVAAVLLVAVGAWLGSGFKAMVEFTAPVFWLFFLLSGIALFVLRAKEPQTERPFRVPLYPVLPVVFCAMCAYMLWSSLSYVYSQELGGLNAAWISVAVLAVGGVLVLAVRGRTARA
ncbi:MAG TPA: amino acid permease [Burkholderiaceae bacterium]|nr:amino acid permease [Burkholderiaceae bacterium]